MASNVKVDKITPTTNCGTVTLGDSGDTISIPSGASLDIGGSVSGIDGIVNWDTTAKTANFTAVAGNGYFVNTTSAAITVTLPASPSAGDLVAVKDYAFTADTNNITLARNGSNIQGTANDFVIDTEGRSVTLIYVDATQGWLLTGASQKSDISGAAFVAATGGTITTCGDYKIHTFTSPGTFCVSSGGNVLGSNSVDYLVLAGGAGGGAGNQVPNCNGGGGGGGGAGGYRESSGAASGCYTASPLGACVSALPVTAQGYPITVGGGGAAGTSPSRQGVSGSNSVFSTITSAGGGGSGGAPTTTPPCATRCASNGGSGGGAGGRSYGPAPLICGGSGNTPPVSPPQGNNGGSTQTGSPSFGLSGAGGGGAGAVGCSATSNTGQAGGLGVSTSITGLSVGYGGGGGGGSGGNKTGGSPTASVPFGGGKGGAATPFIPGPAATGPTAGATNKGGGGGGAGGALNGTGVNSGSAGGSGVVIIRYKYQ
tara:strand:- start:877 stop:2328 length:1452 start_codon:yes stop_codon:yes gene_type:complete